MPSKLDKFRIGLCSQDVHTGLRNVDPSSGAVVQYMESTRLVGMAASLALTIKGQDVVEDAEALKVIVADQLDIDPFAFNQVVGLLEEQGIVYNVERQSGRIKRLYEKVPVHKNVFEQLGEVWEQRGPTEIEASMVATVDALATQPIRHMELGRTLGMDKKAQQIVLDLGRESQLIKSVSLPKGEEVLYSPYFSFENPSILAELFTKHTDAEIQAEFEGLKSYQGLPLSDKLPVLTDAVARGLLTAPSVEAPDGELRSFVFAPYTIGHDYLTTRKSVLEKALAILACVRCGQHFGGYTPVAFPARILQTLLDPSRNRMLKAHSSHRRQYRLLHRMGIVRFIPSGAWVQPQLIDTPDNIEAVKLAMELLKYSGEPLAGRGVPPDAPKLLMNPGRYLTPIMTVQRQRTRLLLTDEHWEKLVNAATGRIRLG